jgi:hypothetical protein
MRPSNAPSNMPPTCPHKIKNKHLFFCFSFKSILNFGLLGHDTMSLTGCSLVPIVLGHMPSFCALSWDAPLFLRIVMGHAPCCLGRPFCASSWTHFPSAYHLGCTLLWESCVSFWDTTQCPSFFLLCVILRCTPLSVCHHGKRPSLLGMTLLYVVLDVPSFGSPSACHFGMQHNAPPFSPFVTCYCCTCPAPFCALSCCPCMPHWAHPLAHAATDPQIWVTFERWESGIWSVGCSLLVESIWDLLISTSSMYL